MKKNNRDQYLKAWLTYLKGKNQLDPKALADFLEKILKGALAPITRKRYTATVIGNLYENGFLAGKTGKTFSGEPLEIVQEITFLVLDKCLTSNYKKVKFTEADQVAEPVEPVAKGSKVKKPQNATRKKKAKKPELVAEKPAKKQAKRTVKPGPKKAVERKPGPAKKKAVETPKKAETIKAKRAPGRKPGKKVSAMVPAVTGRKPAVKKPGLIGRKTDLVRMGEGAFLFAIRQQDQIEEMERVIANYERMFEAVRQLFSREMEEMEELVVGLLE
jgi:hypothetical protein